jgi:hypothetical protein
VQPTNATVPILDAAHQAGVDVEQIRRWAAIGGVEIQRRGGAEVVLVDQVMALAASARRRDPSIGRDALRARLADAKVENARIADLQRAARDRVDGTS